MKINFTQKLKSFEGDPIVNNNKELTLKSVVCNSLAADQKGDAEEKYKKYLLGLKICDSKDELDITPEEAVMITAAVDAIYPAPIVSGQVKSLLK